MEIDPETQELIDECYHGNADKLEADAIRGRRDAIQWNDIQLVSQCHPEFEEEADKLIARFIGFEIEQNISLPHKPFVQALIAGYKNGSIQNRNSFQKWNFIVKESEMTT